MGFTVVVLRGARLSPNAIALRDNVGHKQPPTSPGLTITMLMGGLESTDVVINALPAIVYVKCTNTAVGASWSEQRSIPFFASWSGQRSIPIFAFLNRVSLHHCVVIFSSPL